MKRLSYTQLVDKYDYVESRKTFELRLLLSGTKIEKIPLRKWSASACCEGGGGWISFYRYEMRHGQHRAKYPIFLQ